MVSFNGEECEYDVLGNPVKYRNRSLSWNHLRNLVRYGSAPNGNVSGNTPNGNGSGRGDATFTYDASGLRQTKNHNGTETRYRWAGTRLLAERRIIPTEGIDPYHQSVQPMYGNEEIEVHTRVSGSTYLNANAIDIAYIRGSDGLTGFTVSSRLTRTS